MIRIHNTYLDDFLPEWHNRMEQVQYHILVLVTEGSLTYQLNETILSVRKGELLFIPSGTQRAAHNDPGVLHQKYAVLFAAEPLSPPLPILNANEPKRLRTRAFEYYKERFIGLHRHSLERKTYYETIQSGMLLELLGTFSRELEATPLPLRKDEHIRTMETYILHHMRETIPLSDLALLIQRSPNYTLALFKEAVGQTPLAYQHNIRITAAIEMLQNTNASVASIAEYLGYYDSSYFYKVFRKATGMAPSKYAGRQD